MHSTGETCCLILKESRLFIEKYERINAVRKMSSKKKN